MTNYLITVNHKYFLFFPFFFLERLYISGRSFYTLHRVKIIFLKCGLYAYSNRSGITRSPGFRHTRSTPGPRKRKSSTPTYAHQCFPGAGFSIARSGRPCETVRRTRPESNRTRRTACRAISYVGADVNETARVSMARFVERSGSEPLRISVPIIYKFRKFSRTTF